jgi:hypothetical protein
VNTATAVEPTLIVGRFTSKCNSLGVVCTSCTSCNRFSFAAAFFTKANPRGWQSRRLEENTRRRRIQFISLPRLRVRLLCRQQITWIGSQEMEMRVSSRHSTESYQRYDVKPEYLHLTKTLIMHTSFRFSDLYLIRS